MVSPFSLVYQPCDNKLNFGDLRSKAFQGQETLKEQVCMFSWSPAKWNRHRLLHLKGSRPKVSSFHLWIANAGLEGTLLYDLQLYPNPSNLGLQATWKGGLG